MRIGRLNWLCAAILVAMAVYMASADRPLPEQPFPFQVFFVAIALYLFGALLWWLWRKCIRPAGLLIRDQGIAGLGSVILHGKAALHRSQSADGASDEDKVAK